MKAHNLFSIIPYKDQLIKLDNAEKAFAIYRHYSIDLLTGKKCFLDFNQWIEEYKTIILEKKIEYPRVIHLFYELGFFIEEKEEMFTEDTLLAIDIQFTSFHEVKPLECQKIHLKTLTRPHFLDYKKTFEKGYEELLKGNCYQFNLTYPYIFSFEKSLNAFDFIFSLWKKQSSRGAYGSATFIPFFNQLFLSNSPECLFQYKNKTLSSMPIKGTLRRVNSEDWKPLWKKLTSDIKSQAELYMISDLLRNDLSRIEFPRAKIVKQKSPQLVPGLLHQYSQIDVQLSDTVNLWSVVKKLFPGGSITGAPKKRTMSLIHSLENRDRGFYCGSTIILFKEMKSASINIRSSLIDFKKSTLLYQAGGGITLLSKSHEEFQEMNDKHDSFIRALTL